MLLCGRLAVLRIIVGLAVVFAGSASAQAAVAVDDAYDAPSGFLLEVEAPGVMENDHDGGEEPPPSEPAVATLVADVSHGLLSLNGDGSFTYTSDVGYIGLDTFSYYFVNPAGTSNTATVTITVDGCEPDIAPTQWVCWVEQAYLAKAAELGLSTFVEGFEDDLTWAASREPATTSSITSQTITWASNFAFNDIATGTGPQRSGLFSVYSLPHGDQSGAPGDRIRDGFTGTASNPDSLLGVGGWLVGQIGSRVDFVITHGGGGTTTPGFPDHMVTHVHEFFGFIDTAGFSSFEVVETDGTVNQPYFVFGDDFSFIVSGADTTPPRVTEIGSWEETADGVLSEGEITDVAITELMVRFSETVQDPAGDTDPDDVTNPANYLLFDDGGNGFDTVNCAGGVATGDNQIAVEVWQYLSGDPSETQLIVNGDVALPTGAYRLLVCGTTSIIDWAGNVLDGDGNGAGGDDFVRNFEITGPVNDPPTADPQTVSTAEDTGLLIVLTGSDPDGDPITFAIGTGPTHGVLTGTLPSVTYTPGSNYHGPDSFTFTATDGLLTSLPATVSITVTPVNDPPTADDQSVSTAEDTALGITLTGGDVDGDPLGFFIGTGPAHGALSGALPDVSYTPDADYHGPDSFTFITSDGTLSSPIATVSITVTPVNDTPLAVDDSATTDEDTAVSVAVLVNDDLGDPPTTITAVTQGTSGTVSIDPGATSVTYTPDPDTNGLDSFTYTITDDDLETSIATVSMTVDAINDAPVANAGPDQTFFVTDTVTLDGSGSTDVDGDPLTYAWSFTSVPLGSTASLSDPTAVMPTFVVDEPGDYVIELIVWDGALFSIADTVTISTDNSAPVADAGPDQSVFVTDTVTLDGSGSTDVDGDPLTYAWSFTSVPLGSTASLSDPTAVMPTFVVDEPGSYVIELIVWDGTVFSAPDTVTISTDNSAPVADAGPDQSVLVTDTVTLDGSGSTDVDGDALTYAWSFTSVPLGSTASLSDPAAIMPTFVVDEPGAYVVQLIVHDGTVPSAPDTVTISTSNSAPVADPQSVSTPEDTALGITLTGSDADGDPITFEVVTSPTHGGLTGTLPNLIYTPGANYYGPDSFTFRAWDGTVYGDPATITIDVLPVNDRPTADDQSVSTPEDTALAITLTGGDIDGDALNFVLGTGPTNGGLSGAPPNVTYTPDPDYNGPDSFTFTADDGVLTSTAATVSITVTPVNDAPTADAGPDQSVFVTDTVTLDGSGSTDVDGDALTYAWSFTSVPLGSTASLSDPTAIMPTFVVDEPGAYVVQLIVHDGTVPSAPNTVTISTSNSAPVADPQSVSTPEDTALGITLTGSDVDGDVFTFEVVDSPTHGALTGTLPDLIYTPGANYHGPESFTFRTFDGSLYSTPATVSITVTPVNDPPTADDQLVSTAEDTELAITLTGGDVDGDALGFFIGTGPAHGALAGALPDVSYTPDADYHGPDGFTFITSDGTLSSPIATVSITVTPVNDTPLAVDDSATTDEDTAVSIAVLLNDSLGDPPTTITAVTQGTNGTVAIDPGGTSVTYTPDPDTNGFDSFTYTITDADLETSTASVTVTVNPAADPVLTIGDADISEPDTGSLNVTVTITVSEQSQSAITVDFATADGTAVAGVDYFGASGALTIPALATSYDLILEVIGDTVDEPDEDFSVTLSNPVGAVLGTQASGTVTILDNDPMAELSAVDVMVGEGSGMADISVSLNQSSGFDVTFDYTTADGTATTPGDYGAVNGVADIPRGSTSTVISVPIVDDGEVEPDEFFTVDLWVPTNAVLLTPTVTVTIIDNDGCDIPGDANGDCLLDAADLALIISRVDDPAVFTLGDPDCTGDGFVDGSDLVCVAQALVAQ